MRFVCTQKYAILNNQKTAHSCCVSSEYNKNEVVNLPSTIVGLNMGITWQHRLGLGNYIALEGNPLESPPDSGIQADASDQGPLREGCPTGR